MDRSVAVVGGWRLRQLPSKKYQMVLPRSSVLDDKFAVWQQGSWSHFVT